MGVGDVMNTKRIKTLAKRHSLETINGGSVDSIEIKIQALGGPAALRAVRKYTQQWVQLAEQAAGPFEGSAVSAAELLKIDAELEKTLDRL